LTDSTCRQLNKDITCFYYGLRQGTTGWARSQAALAEQGQSELRMLAQMQAQAEMQDFGNRLQQVGSWLQSINPSIPAAPSIPRTLDCSDFCSPGYPCRQLASDPLPILESEANCPSFPWEGLFLGPIRGKRDHQCTTGPDPLTRNRTEKHLDWFSQDRAGDPSFCCLRSRGVGRTQTAGYALLNAFLNDRMSGGTQKAIASFQLVFEMQ
jgi:hypothetical protein